MASAARSEEDRYYGKIASIQQSMRQREKRRLELERELFTYSRSDTRILQIKCSKLRSYLKEISNREARAKMRNLELQRDVECIEISMKEYGPDHGLLRQQKDEFFKKISKFMEERKKMELEAPKIKAVQIKHRDSSLFQPAKTFTQSPTVIFMDHQTSRTSDAEAGTTSVLSHQALHRSPNHGVHSLEHLPSGRLKEFRVGREDATRNRANLSDDISGSNDSPDACNFTDKHERMMAVLPSVCAFTGASGSVPFRSDDEQELSPLVTSTGPEENPPPSGRGPTRAKDSPAERTDSQEMAHQPPIMEAGERGHSHLVPETTFGREAQDTPGSWESVNAPSSDAQLSESSASDLSISLTQSELEEDLLEDVESERNATSGGNGDHSRHSPESSLHSDGSKNTSPAATVESLSHKGLFHLLDGIEGRLHGEWTRVYGDSSIDGGQLNRLIGLCNRGAGLNGEDLGACGALVLHELRRLSWSTAKGCLLPQDLVRSHQSNPDPEGISASLPPDAARLWDRWFKHALLLKECRVLNTERLVQLFTPLLLECHASYSHQAKVLLRTLLSRSSEECPSAEDESDLSSSRDSPPLPADSDVKPARPVQQRQIQELQSAEEDSQDESPVESVPIRETKAYQLLKQSAMQQRLQSSEEEEEEEEEEEDGLSGINHGHEEDLGRAKRSSHQDPYPRTDKTNSKAHSAVQSKGIWGESDDSNSEIEAALRPQPFNTNNGDIDDFYD
ncbi:putative centrosomal protein kizuna [Scophthalmus maximus]|uniref:Centrosomal protein kizuna n=1 Tax=Scophthalmus maximus TaxID=52904 RepID=A0A2U9CJH1_SCOMX|nr:putative centrosomal protein kizuna [Scophthalmus maximus]